VSVSTPTGDRGGIVKTANGCIDLPRVTCPSSRVRGAGRRVYFCSSSWTFSIFLIVDRMSSRYVRDRNRTAGATDPPAVRRPFFGARHSIGGGEGAPLAPGLWLRGVGGGLQRGANMWVGGSGYSPAAAPHYAFGRGKSNHKAPTRIGGGASVDEGARTSATLPWVLALMGIVIKAGDEQVMRE